MRSSLFTITAALLRAALMPRTFHFVRQLHDPERAQRKVVLQLMRCLSETHYGGLYNISHSDSYEAYREKVPIVTYDELLPWIKECKSSSAPILTRERIKMFERTSGSSGAVKYIPYTKPLLRSFSRMFLLWCHDLLTYGPQLREGRVFMSISPSCRDSEVTENGISIGTSDDTEYVQSWIGMLLKRFLVVPLSAGRIRDIELHSLVVALHLLAEEKLEIVSIWSPTFLESILRFIEENREDIAGFWQKGYVELNGERFSWPLPTSARLKQLMDGHINWSALWPHLKLISCWSSANAAASSRRLQSMFPGALLQGKGLLATEAPLTIPLLRYRGRNVPLVNEVLYEFEDQSGGVIPLWKVEEGRTYSLVISQRGGLYRYKIGDKVRINGIAEGTPCFDFVGRDRSSDLVGEKVHEDFVADVIEALRRGSGSEKILLPIAPANEAPYYVLLCEEGRDSSESLELSLDNLLRQSYHYDYARRRKQLERPLVIKCRLLGDQFIRFSIDAGVKSGDIKVPTLLADETIAWRFLQRLLGIQALPQSRSELINSLSSSSLRESA